MNDINKPQITRVIRSVIFQIDFHDFLLRVFSANSKCENLWFDEEIGLIRGRGLEIRDLSPF